MPCGRRRRYRTSRPGHSAGTRSVEMLTWGRPGDSLPAGRPSAHGILNSMHRAILIGSIAIVAACSQTSEPLTEAYPDAARQIAVEGADNVELLCELGAIGGVLGPTAPEPLQAAEALAQERGWRYDSLVETGGTNDRRLIVFSDAKGAPVAEVAVAKHVPGIPPTTAPEGAHPPDLDDKATGWTAVGVQVCEQA